MRSWIWPAERCDCSFQMLAFAKPCLQWLYPPTESLNAAVSMMLDCKFAGAVSYKTECSSMQAHGESYTYEAVKPKEHAVDCRYTSGMRRLMRWHGNPQQAHSLAQRGKMRPSLQQLMHLQR